MLTVVFSSPGQDKTLNSRNRSCRFLS